MHGAYGAVGSSLPSTVQLSLTLVLMQSQFGRIKWLVVFNTKGINVIYVLSEIFVYMYQLLIT